MSPGEYEEQVCRDMLEEVLLQRVRQQSRALGWISYHTRYSKGSDAGFPDLVLVNVRQRRIMFRELKREREEPSPAQRMWLAALEAVGMDAGWWRPSDLFNDRIDNELRSA